MPSTSKKQHNFMAAVANNPSFAKKAGVPQSVGKDFNQADKGRKFAKGGDMKPVDMKKNPGVAKLPTAVRNKMGFMKEGGIATSLKAHAAAPASKAHGMKSGGMAASKMGSVKTSATRDGVASKGKTKGKMIKMNMGGRAC
jgi:hypothetical protein